MAEELDQNGYSESDLEAEKMFIRKARAPPVRVDGISSKSLVVRLSKNALVRSFDVIATAARADAALLGNVAQVRLQSNTTGDATVVADLGAPRTVAKVGVSPHPPAPITIASVKAWNGVQFYSPPVYQADVATDVAPFDSEVSTARLMMVLHTTVSIDDISSNVWVQLSDAPADLQISIDGAAPVWRFAGPVPAGLPPWNGDGTTPVALAPALAQLTGDPTDETPHNFNVVLTSRIPGVIDLELATTSGAIDVSYLQRVDLGPDGKRDIEFDAEGQVTVTLALRDWTKLVEGATFTVLAALPPERAVPPIGPPIATLLGGNTADGGAAELVLDIDHSACVQPPVGSSLAELTAIRLPLRSDAAGAEVRVVLLAPGAEPGAPIPGGASASVTIAPPAPDDDPDPWLTFAFARPVKIAEAAPPWVQVVVVRGAVHWTLGSFNGAANPLRRGPTAGPWQPLPAVLSDENSIGGRVRLVGHAVTSKPIAPLTFSMVGAASDVPVTPVAKGVTATLTAVSPIAPQGAAGHLTVDLVVTSAVAGTVTLRDIDVTATQ